MDNQPQNDQQFIPTTTGQSSWYEPLCRPSRTSKILAAFVMVVLPFVGGYVGYQMSTRDSAVMVSSSSSTQLVATSEAVVPTTSAPSFVPADYEPPHAEMVARFAKSPSTVRFVDPRLESNIDSSNAVAFDYFKNYSELANVIYGDQMAADVSALPYLFLVASATDFIVFSAPMFKETEGSESGLYKYDTHTKMLTTMKTSNRYFPIMTGGKISPDDTKLALTNNPYPPTEGVSAAGTEIGYIDLVNDTYVSLKQLNIDETGRFCIHEMACSSDFEWKSTTVIEAEITYWTKCSSQMTNPKDEGDQSFTWNSCTGSMVKSETVTLEI